MNKDQVKKIVARNGIFWFFAIIIPCVVMVILDMFDRHTPTSVAMCSSACIMFPCVLAMQSLSKQLESLIPTQNDQ